MEEKQMQRKRMAAMLALLLAVSCLWACGDAQNKSEETTDITVWLNMNQNYAAPQLLEDGEGAPVKVILLLGQSNATGCSLTSYLRQGVGEEAFATYEAGYPSVLINFSIDDQKYTSNGEFVPVDLHCAAGEGCFGPELGIAEVLAAAYPNETVVLLKYTMSGYSLHHHWLCNGERGSIYQACLAFVNTYMQALQNKNFDARIGAVCWMQGESDTTDFKGERYYGNQTKFVSYLREDLATYAEQGGICFIDAGISNSPYCEPAYPAINAAKEKFAKDSPLNFYFSTIEAGLTIHKEPEGDPDWGHYDAMSELTLGRLFGEAVVRSYQMREDAFLEGEK
jgi:hypothetical protein